MPAFARLGDEENISPLELSPPMLVTQVILPIALRFLLDGAWDLPNNRIVLADCDRSYRIYRPAQLILARQEDDFPGEIEDNLLQRKVSELDRLGEHDMAVPILAGKRRGLVRMHGEPPKLKLLGGSARQSLAEGDFIEQPVCPAGFGDVPVPSVYKMCRTSPWRYQRSVPVNCDRSELSKRCMVIRALRVPGLPLFRR